MEFQLRQKSAEPTASRANQTLPDQISKARAVWQVTKISAEIQNLKKSYAEHTRRVTLLSEELLYCANKHIELNAAKDAEIAQAFKEMETQYDNLHADVRRYDKWAENEKARETIMTRNNHEGEREEGEREEGEREEGEREEGEREEAGRTGQSQ
jgi:hypothetical protein